MVFLKPYKKIIATLLSLTVSLFSSAFSLIPPASAQEIRVAVSTAFVPLGIPRELASIEEVFIPEAEKDRAPLIHIQSIHAHAETQKKIYALLKFLDEKYGIRSLFIEGAGEELNPAYFRFFDDNRLNVRVAQNLLEKGELTGAELFLIESSKKIPAYGLEDPRLYRENLTSFQNVMSQRPLTTDFIQNTRSAMDRLETLLLQPGARRLLRLNESFDSGKMDLFSYLLELERKAKEILNVDLRHFENQLDWPYLMRLLRLSELESKLDPEKIQSDRQKLTTYMKGLGLDPSLTEAFETLSYSPFQSGMVYDPGFRKNDLPRYLAERLVLATLEKGFSFERYPYFTRYLEAAILQSELEAKRLFNEFERLNESLIRSVSPGEDQWNLVESVHKERLLERLFDLELTPKDYAKMKVFNEVDRPLVRFLIGTQSLQEKTRARQTQLIPSNIETVESVYSEAIRFYELAKEREETMINRILEWMPSTSKQSSSPVTVLITGGFHTEGLSQGFRKRQIPYTLLSPRVTEKVSTKAYISSLLGEKKTAFDVQYLEKGLDLQGMSEMLYQMWPEPTREKQHRSEVRVVLQALVETLDWPTPKFIYKVNGTKYADNRRLRLEEDKEGNIIPRVAGELLLAKGLAIGQKQVVKVEERKAPAPVVVRTSGANGGGVSLAAQKGRPQQLLKLSPRGPKPQNPFTPPSLAVKKSNRLEIIPQGERPPQGGISVASQQRTVKQAPIPRAEVRGRKPGKNQDRSKISKKTLIQKTVFIAQRIGEFPRSSWRFIRNTTWKQRLALMGIFALGLAVSLVTWSWYYETKVLKLRSVVEKVEALQRGEDVDISSEELRLILKEAPLRGLEVIFVKKIAVTLEFLKPYLADEDPNVVVAALRIVETQPNIPVKEAGDPQGIELIRFMEQSRAKPLISEAALRVLSSRGIDFTLRMTMKDGTIRSKKAGDLTLRELFDAVVIMDPIFDETLANALMNKVHSFYARRGQGIPKDLKEIRIGLLHFLFLYGERLLSKNEEEQEAFVIVSSQLLLEQREQAIRDKRIVAGAGRKVVLAHYHDHEDRRFDTDFENTKSFFEKTGAEVETIYGIPDAAQKYLESLKKYSGEKLPVTFWEVGHGWIGSFVLSANDRLNAKQMAKALIDGQRDKPGKEIDLSHLIFVKNACRQCEQSILMMEELLPEAAAEIGKTLKYPPTFVYASARGRLMTEIPLTQFLWRKLRLNAGEPLTFEHLMEIDRILSEGNMILTYPGIFIPNKILPSDLNKRLGLPENTPTPYYFEISMQPDIRLEDQFVLANTSRFKSIARAEVRSEDISQPALVGWEKIKEEMGHRGISGDQLDIIAVDFRQKNAFKPDRLEAVFTRPDSPVQLVEVRSEFTPLGFGSLYALGEGRIIKLDNSSVNFRWVGFYKTRQNSFRIVVAKRSTPNRDEAELEFFEVTPESILNEHSSFRLRGIQFRPYEDFSLIVSVFSKEEEEIAFQVDDQDGLHLFLLGEDTPRIFDLETGTLRPRAEVRVAVQNAEDLLKELKRIREDKTKRDRIQEIAVNELKENVETKLATIRTAVSTSSLAPEVQEAIEKMLSVSSKPGVPLKINREKRNEITGLIIFLQESGIALESFPSPVAVPDGQVFLVVGHHETEKQAETMFDAVRPLLPPLPEKSEDSQEVLQPEIVIHIEVGRKGWLKQMLQSGLIDDKAKLLKMYKTFQDRDKKQAERDSAAMRRGELPSDINSRPPFFKGIYRGIVNLRTRGYRVRVFYEDPEPETWWLWDRSELIGTQELSTAFVKGEEEAVERLAEQLDLMRYRADAKRDLEEEGPKINERIKTFPKATHLILRGSVHDYLIDFIRVPAERKRIVFALPDPVNPESFRFPMDRLYHLRRAGRLVGAEGKALEEQLRLQELLLSLLGHPIVQTRSDYFLYIPLLIQAVSQMSAEDIRRIIRSFQNPLNPPLQDRPLEVYYRVKANFPQVIPEGGELARITEESILKINHNEPYLPVSTTIPPSRAEVRTTKDPRPVISVDHESQNLLNRLRGATPETLPLILKELESRYLAYRNVYLVAFREELLKWLKEKASDKWKSDLPNQVQALLAKIISSLPPENEDVLFPPYREAEAPQVAVIIPIFNRPKDPKSDLKKKSLGDLLRSLQTLDYPSEKLKVIIVDNGSPDVTFAPQIKREFPHVRLLRSSENLGFAGGMNAGIRDAQGRGAEYFFLANDDTYVNDPKILTKLVRASEQEGVGLVGMPLVNPSRGRWVEVKGLKNIPASLRGKESTPQYDEVEAVAGSAFLVSRKLVDRVGLMDDRFFLYFEEADWNARASRQGFRNVIVKTTRMVHKEEGGGVFNPQSAYYLMRNSVFYARRNYEDFYTRSLWPLRTYLGFVLLALQRRENSFQTKLKILLNATRGLLDGFLGRWQALSPSLLSEISETASRAEVRANKGVWKLFERDPRKEKKLLEEELRGVAAKAGQAATQGEGGSDLPGLIAGLVSQIRPIDDFSAENPKAVAFVEDLSRYLSQDRRFLALLTQKKSLLSRIFKELQTSRRAEVRSEIEIKADGSLRVYKNGVEVASISNDGTFWLNDPSNNPEWTPKRAKANIERLLGSRQIIDVLLNTEAGLVEFILSQSRIVVAYDGRVFNLSLPSPAKGPGITAAIQSLTIKNGWERIYTPYDWNEKETRGKKFQDAQLLGVMQVRDMTKEHAKLRRHEMVEEIVVKENYSGYWSIDHNVAFWIVWLSWDPYEQIIKYTDAAGAMGESDVVKIHLATKEDPLIGLHELNDKFYVVLRAEAITPEAKANLKKRMKDHSRIEVVTEEEWNALPKVRAEVREGTVKSEALSVEHEKANASLFTRDVSQLSRRAEVRIGLMSHEGSGLNLKFAQSLRKLDDPNILKLLSDWEKSELLGVLPSNEVQIVRLLKKSFLRIPTEDLIETPLPVTVTSEEAPKEAEWLNTLLGVVRENPKKAESRLRLLLLNIPGGRSEESFAKLLILIARVDPETRRLLNPAWVNLIRKAATEGWDAPLKIVNGPEGPALEPNLPSLESNEGFGRAEVRSGTGPAQTYLDSYEKIRASLEREYAGKVTLKRAVALYVEATENYRKDTGTNKGAYEEVNIIHLFHKGDWPDLLNNLLWPVYIVLTDRDSLPKDYKKKVLETTGERAFALEFLRNVIHTALQNKDVTKLQTIRNLWRVERTRKGSSRAEVRMSKQKPKEPEMLLETPPAAVFQLVSVEMVRNSLPYVKDWFDDPRTEKFVNNLNQQIITTLKDWFGKEVSDHGLVEPRGAGRLWEKLSVQSEKINFAFNLVAESIGKRIGDQATSIRGYKIALYSLAKETFVPEDGAIDKTNYYESPIYSFDLPTKFESGPKEQRSELREPLLTPLERVKQITQRSEARFRIGEGLEVTTGRLPLTPVTQTSMIAAPEGFFPSPLLLSQLAAAGLINPRAELRITREVTQNIMDATYEPSVSEFLLEVLKMAEVQTPEGLAKTREELVQSVRNILPFLSKRPTQPAILFSILDHVPSPSELRAALIPSSANPNLLLFIAVAPEALTKVSLPEWRKRRSEALRLVPGNRVKLFYAPTWNGLDALLVEKAHEAHERIVPQVGFQKFLESYFVLNFPKTLSEANLARIEGKVGKGMRTVLDPLKWKRREDPRYPAQRLVVMTLSAKLDSLGLWEKQNYFRVSGSHYTVRIETLENYASLITSIETYRRLILAAA